MRQLVRRVWYLLRRRQVDADLAEELAFHREMTARDLEAGGVSSADAALAARRAMGSTALAHDRAHDVWIRPWLQDLLEEPRIACRSLLKSPATSAAAIALVAVVVGGNTTIYSAVHGLLTKPAPGVRADRLVTLDVLHNGRSFGAIDSYPDYRDYAAQATTVRPLLAIGFEAFTLARHEGSYALRGDLVTRNYFETLGLAVARGRTFTSEESRRHAPVLAAIISDRLWHEQFQGAGDIVGRPVTLDGHPATIVGVMPPAFRGALFGERADIWVPLLAWSTLDRANGNAIAALNDRSTPRLTVMGRLAPGVSMARAQAEFNTITARLQRAHPDTNGGMTLRLLPYSMMAGGNSLLAESLPRFLAIFSIVTLLTLLIVCANIANLMLARAVVRQREMAVRQSLGASRVRILRMLLVEGAILSLVAWAVALVFAVWVSHALVRVVPPPGRDFASYVDFTPDWTVAGYALALALVAMIAFTIGPSIRAWHQQPLPWLKAGEQGIVQGRSKLSAGLVVLQLAFSILLLVSAGLAYRSLTLLQGRALGFDPQRTALVTVNTIGSATSRAANTALLDRLRDRLATIPGMASVSYARGTPDIYWSRVPVRREGSAHAVAVQQNLVGPGFLATYGLTPRAGRDFTTADDGSGPRGAVIDQSLANELWPGASSIGRPLQLGPDRRAVEVIGVAPNALFRGYSTEDRPHFIFLAEAQQPVAPGLMTFYLRGRDAIDIVAPDIRRALAAASPGTPIVSLSSMDVALQSDMQPIRMVTTLLIVFALGSLLIAGIGQYAIVAFDMRRRTRELGVRIALGASGRQILAAVVREGLGLTVAGLVVGFALSIAAGTALRGLLYGVTPTDARTYAGVFVLLACASLAACYLPARRASRVDPVRVLRQE